MKWCNYAKAMTIVYTGTSIPDQNRMVHEATLFPGDIRLQYAPLDDSFPVMEINLVVYDCCIY